MSLHNFLLFHLRRHVKNSGFLLHHGFQIPRNRWKHSACGLVLSSVSRYLEPVIKHSPSFLTYYFTVVERVHHGLFLGPHHGWIHGEILSLKNLKVMARICFLSSLSSMGWWMCVVRARSCLLERVEPQLLWCGKLPFVFSQHWGFHNFVWILHWRVVIVLPCWLDRNRQGIVRFGGLWPSQYLSV